MSIARRAPGRVTSVAVRLREAVLSEFAGWLREQRQTRAPSTVRFHERQTLKWPNVLAKDYTTCRLPRGTG